MAIRAATFRQGNKGGGYFSESIDLPECAAGVTAKDITLATKGKVKKGDLVIVLGHVLAETSIVVNGANPAPADDKVRFRINNITGAPVNPAAATFFFLVVKRK